MTEELKTCDFSSQQKDAVFCFVRCVWQPAPGGGWMKKHGRMTVYLSVLGLCSPPIQTLCTRNRGGENTQQDRFYGESGSYRYCGAVS